MSLARYGHLVSIPVFKKFDTRLLNLSNQLKRFLFSSFVHPLVYQQNSSLIENNVLCITVNNRCVMVASMH